MFDMLNYGDLLFPLVAAARLAPHGFEVIPVAPTSLQLPLADAMRPVSFIDSMQHGAPADGVLIGGGYTIHGHRLDLFEQYRAGDAGAWAANSLWLGATLAGAVWDAPIAWNAPGIPHPLPASHRDTVTAATRAADYVSLRDSANSETLNAAPDDDVSIVPDTIIDLARLWPDRDLAASMRVLMARKHAAPEARFAAIHLRNRSLAGLDHASAAAMIDRFARETGLTPIIIAVGQSHNDDALARSLSKHVGAEHVLLDDPTSLLEITAAIGCSQLYIGASLHGYIVAAAYAVPALVVAKPAYGKFAGFLAHIDRPEDGARDWQDAFARGATWRDRSGRKATPKRVFEALDRHWERIVSAFNAPENKRAARRRFLRKYFQQGLERGGGAWMNRPFTNRDPMRNPVD